MDVFNEEPSKLKRAVIAGASEALKIKKSANKSEEEIIQTITKRMDEIISRID
ncbi:hypothetical protein J4477_00615 [Candidatus Pacearchaeota archaeon]|nr:hypothetical protein [Candidatus Pacearchaeota archaeon]